MIRLFDLIISTLGLIVLFPVLVVIFFLALLDTGSPVFFQERLGRDKKLFLLIKFRSMRIGTASIATHLVDESSITKFGYYLRKYKLDELPQLFNVLLGDMSLVGPRPCLISQLELIVFRDKYDVFKVRPGITGSAQIMGVNMSKPELLAKIDSEMISSMTAKKYFGIILGTIRVIL